MASPTPLDAFTSRRIVRFAADFRARSGTLPTLPDFDAAGFPVETVKAAVRAKLIAERYVTLTSGTVMKGYVVEQPGV